MPKKQNTRVEVTFTYDLPDQYLYQTNDLKKTGTWTYKGPDKKWIFIDATTKKIIGRFHYLESDDGADVPTPEGQIKVLVDANVNPVISSLLHNEYIYGDLDHTHEDLPNGTAYGVPDPLPPDHCYELTEIQYDVTTNTFVKPFPWKKPHVTWDDIKAWRNAHLAASDMKFNTATPDTKQAWATYRQLLRDIPETFKGIDPWKVAFPQSPDEQTPQTFTTGPAANRPSQAAKIAALASQDPGNKS